MKTLQKSKSLNRTTVNRHGRTGLLSLGPWLAVVTSLLLVLPGPVGAQNIASSGTAILGYQAAVDGTPGTLYFHVGTAANINDGDPTTHVDNWTAGADQGQSVSFVGIVWPSLRYDKITDLTLTLATFLDGGWFGVSGYGPGAGRALAATNLIEPTIQVSTNGGLSWTKIAATSDYISTLTGFTIGGGANPNPNSVTAHFTLPTPATEINGIRIIGPNGGNAGTDPNGFIGVYELEANATPPVDTDNDGMPDAWMNKYFGHPTGQASDLSRAQDDADNDGLTTMQEFIAGTDPKKADTDSDSLTDGDEVNKYLTNPVKADTDSDGLSDGDEVNKYKTDPLNPDTDGDGLSDGDEVNKYRTNPLLADTDGDGYPDGVEVALGSNPNDPKSIPGNLALQGTGILGTEDTWGGTDTALFHVGTAANITDGSVTTRVDTWNNTSPDTLSFVGVLWNQPLTNPVARLELTLATFFDGGWFGPNNKGPGSGGALTPAYLTEPTIQISTDGGTTWTNVAHVSDYLRVFNGHRIGGGAVPNPSSRMATFFLPKPVAGITGVRIIGTEGGTASGGFLGVFELAVYGFIDTDKDGMDDDWERKHGLNVGVNDAALDPDNDGLTNLQEYLAGTDPQNADSDGDGLKDGYEVNVYHSNPNSADTDIALRGDARAILGTEDTWDGTDTPRANVGTTANINDGSLTTRVDNWNGGLATVGDTLSYVGILWTNQVTNVIASMQLTLATFLDGGWFGVNGQGPGAGGALTTNYLREPIVQITIDGGASWSEAPHTSDYLTALNGATIGGGANANPKAMTANFTLTPAVKNINGIRLIGTEGGTASGGFLGVFALVVRLKADQPATLAKAAMANGQFQFQFDSLAGSAYVVQYKNALTDSAWQTLLTITGDGTRKTVTDTTSTVQRFYRVTSQ